MYVLSLNCCVCEKQNTESGREREVIENNEMRDLVISKVRERDLVDIRSATEIANLFP
jgi:hypothetical protein